MRRPMLSFITMFTACSLAPEAHADVRVERLRLECGPRVIIAHAPDAPRQTVVCFLPIHLANDPANQPQWSHLIEHMLIRAVDPDPAGANGMLINGETAHQSMRLEIIAEPEQWREAVGRCAKWLAARSVDRTVLAREKRNIAGEEQTTAARGFTSKWAIAAWNQAVRHGARHIALHQAVANAEAEDVERAIASRVSINPSVLIATIGPVEPDAIEAALREDFAQLAPAAADPAPARRDRQQMQQPHAATWDLPASHALVWWPLPDEEPATLAAATVLSANLIPALSAVLPQGDSGFRAIIFEHVPTPDGSFLIADVSARKHQPDAPSLHNNVRLMLRKWADEPAMMLVTGEMLAAEANATPDFEAMRKSWPAAHHHLVEAQWLVRSAALEYAWNEPLDAIARELAACDQQRVVELMRQLLAAPAGTLSLRPALTPSERE